ncbi:MAG: NUDIX domain-containing protein [Clostridia bacterium]|nr:NUDIX domain-containing protein [Clostridia bacterium]
MKEISIYGDNYFGSYTKTREASRGIVLKGGMILTAHAARGDVWMIPGGGIEKGETSEDAVVREVQEETGYIVCPVREFLTISEYYEGARYDSHYFLCEIVGEGETALTEAERTAGLEAVWENADQLTERFSRHADFAASDEEKRGMYLREWTAMQALFDGE